MDIKIIKRIEKANQNNLSDSTKISIVLMFFIVVSIIAVAFGARENVLVLVFSAVIGAYMAMNVGANDVANNVGPAVGSKAITLLGAIAIAAIFEALGAIIAGADVVDTIKSGIIAPESVQDSKTFICVMLGALLASALWLHLATLLGAPVSTTHSLVGGILGAGIVAGGIEVINWIELGKIASSWIISPVLGGIIAVCFLVLIKYTITYKDNKQKAAKTMIPILIATMSWAFVLYMSMKGLKRVLPISFEIAFFVALLTGVLVYLIARPLVTKKIETLSNTKEDIGTLFTLPLIFAAAMLSFAHGANDVSNAIGPLAAINQELSTAGAVVFQNKAEVPFWVLLIGGLGIAIGLALYGPRLIKTVGNEITELDKIRAFCVAMSAAITVLIASQLGLPVSSTHITIGAIFGIGFFREYLKKKYYEMEQAIIDAHRGKDSLEVEQFLARFNKADIRQKGEILKTLKHNKASQTLQFSKKEKKNLKKVYKNELVKRSTINKIIASWLITVPVSALLGAVACFIAMSLELSI